MKPVRQLLMTLAVVSAFVSAFFAVHAQSGTTQGTRGRNDPIQRELMRRFESDAIERALAASPRRGPENERRLILVQIKADFLRIQVVDDDLKQATRGASIDLKAVAKSASEITSRARRLKDNLALPESWPEIERTPRTSDPHGSNSEPSVEQLRLSLSVLSNSIQEFVANPVFEKAGVVDAKLSAKARHDLEQIIEGSKQAKRASEKLLRARPRAAPFTSSPASSARSSSSTSPASLSRESRISRSI